MKIFKIGQAVVIKCNHEEYDGKYAGKCGFVRKFAPALVSVGIEFDDVKNSNSQYGLFWFDKKNLKPLHAVEVNNEIEIKESEEIKMLNGYKTVLVKFLDGTNTDKRYAYASYDEVNEDDYVVVKTGHHGWGIAQVSEILNEDYEVECSREIIAKFDPSAYFTRIEKIKRLSEIKKSMDAKVKELQHLAIYEALAKDNSEMKELLDEFKSLI